MGRVGTASRQCCLTVFPTANRQYLIWAGAAPRAVLVDFILGSQVSALRSQVQVIRYRCGFGQNSDPEPVPEPEDLNLVADS